MEIQIEEVVVEAGSALANKTIKDADIIERNGVLIIALKKKNGKILFNPPTDNLIGVGNKLAVIGEPEHFNELEQMAKGEKRRSFRPVR